MRKSNLFAMATLFAGSLSATAIGAPSDIVWTDSATNPVIKSPGFGDNRAYYGTVVFDTTANKWRAWYDASSGADIGYAESTDATGTSWTNYTATEGYTTAKQSKAFVLQTGPTQFRMWYMADDRAGGYWIYTAVSSDGINWSQDQVVSGMAADEMSNFGPTERIAVEQLADGSFVAFVRQEEPDLDFENWVQGTKLLYRYTSPDGIAWTWKGSVGVSEVEELGGYEFSSVVKHPDIPGVWYAWGTPANGSSPIASFVSTDDGQTFQLDEAVVANVGDVNTASYNVERNYHASVTYLGEGKWVMFRSVAEPKTTAIATGVEQIQSRVMDWEIR